MMSRTTLDIDDAVLRRVRSIAVKSGKSIGQTVSELLAIALAAESRVDSALQWETSAMRARVDLEDREGDSEEWSAFEKDIYMADIGYGVMAQWEYVEATTDMCSFTHLVGETPPLDGNIQSSH